nr:unnamed protein product [Digitaria exilis]
MGCRSSRLDAAEVSPAAALCRERRDLLRAAADHRAQLAAAHAAYFRALPRVADALARFASHHHAATPPGSPVLTLPPASDGHGNEDDGQPKKRRSGSGSATPHTDSGHSHIHFNSDDASDSDPDSSADPCAAPGGCGGGHGEIPQPAPVRRSGVPLPDHGHGERQERQIHQPRPAMPEMRREYASYSPYPSFPSTAFQNHGTYSSFPSTAFENGAYPSSFPNTAFQNGTYPSSFPNAGFQNGTYPSSFPNAHTEFQNDTYNSFPDTEFQNSTFPSYYYMKASSTPANTVYQEPYGDGNFATSSSYMGYNYGYNNPMYGVPLPPEGDRPVQDRGREPEPPAAPPPMPVPETSPWDFFNPFESYEQELPQYKVKGYDSNGSFTSSPNSSEVRAREGIPELEEETEMESMRESVKARKAVESTASNRIDNVDISAKVKVSMEHKEGEIESVDSASVLESGEESVCSCDCDHANARTGEPMPLGNDQGKVKKVSSQDHSSMVVGEDVQPPHESIGTRDVSDVVQEIKEQFNSVAACGDDVARILEVGRMRYRSRNRVLRLIFSRMMGTFALLFSPLSEAPAKNLEQSAIDSSKRIQNSSKRFDLSSDVELNTLSATMDRFLNSGIFGKRKHDNNVALRLVRMWKFILECHRKQFHTILETRSHILIPKNGPERSSSKEKEETPDGFAPFSPGRLGAPAVFIAANDWCQAMKRIPEGTVVETMEAFAVNVHILWERQDEEQQQKLKADYLSRDFAKRLKSLQKEHGLQGHFEADKPVLPVAEDGKAVDNRMVALDTLHKRLDEQRAKHEETVKQIREASATDLKAGLAPIFEALESFTQETLRGYENVRITVGSG